MTMMNERLDDRMMEGNPADFFATGSQKTQLTGVGGVPFPAIKTAGFQADPFIGEMINERMEFQSPARDKIIRNDLGLNPATLGAGFQMQGTNAPTALTNTMSGQHTLTGNVAGMGKGYGMQFDPSQRQSVPNVTGTDFYNLQDNAFAMGSPANTGTISSMAMPQSGFSDYYGLRINAGDPGANPMGIGYNASAATAQNFDFPMGGRYNYFTNPMIPATGYVPPIMNYDPYNALANTGMYGYDFSQPFYPRNETFGIYQQDARNMTDYNPFLFDPFQSYR